VEDNVGADQCVCPNKKMISRYSRQELLSMIGKEGQEKISKGKVVIIGCGALGTHIANGLARAGIGNIRIIDRDFIELHNLQRQILFTEEDIKKELPKAVAAKEHLEKINSEINIEATVRDVNFTNIEKFIKGFDVVVDGTDNFSTRYLINEACDKLSIPWIYGGAISTYGMSLTIVPGKTPCLACNFPLIPSPDLALTCDTSGVLSSTVSIAASVQLSETLKILTGSSDLNKTLFSFDVWSLRFHNFETKKNPECSICVKKEYKLLKGDKGLSISNLCGQDSIQLIDLKQDGIDLKLLEERISKFSNVKANKFLLKFSVDSKDVTVFKDGRTIIKGIIDQVEAKTFYNKYLGG